jgi:hypothetical protein
MIITSVAALRRNAMSGWYSGVVGIPVPGTNF